jgi:hypothetical protein
MGETWSRTVNVPLLLRLVEFVDDGDQRGIPCPGCGRLLGLHQPEEESPAHLLGTCDCGQDWAAIEVLSEHSAMLMALPAPSSLVASIDDDG